MSHARAGIFAAFAILAGIIAPAIPADAQSVISAHAGVVHYFEGTVFLDDQPLQSHLGKYASVPEGSELRTANGRAEVLLTPGVFLRMNKESAIRMVANDLADTRIELLAGSAIVESGEPNPGTSVSLIYKDWSVHSVWQGTYRIDADPPHLWVRQGEVRVSSGNEQPVTLQTGMSMAFANVLEPERSIREPQDSLSEWTAGRSESIAADNAITAQIDEDPAALTASADNPVFFPVLGVPPVVLDPTGLYSPAALYEPGFNSIYLPGYTYRPSIIGLPGRGLQSYPFRGGGMIGIPPSLGTGAGNGLGTGVGVLTPLPRPPVGLTPLPRPPVRLTPIPQSPVGLTPLPQPPAGLTPLPQPPVTTAPAPHPPAPARIGGGLR